MALFARKTVPQGALISLSYSLFAIASSVASFSPSQRDQARRLAFWLFLGPVLEDSASVLDTVQKAQKSVLCERVDEGKKVFGYEWLRRNGSPWFVPFEANTTMTYNEYAEKQKLPLRAAPPNDKAIRDEYTTLGDIVANLNTRSEGGSRFLVDKWLESKPITVFGGGNVSPDHLFPALAEVYGLRVVSIDQNKSRLLTRRSGRPVSDPAELLAAVRRVLPEPLLRAAHEGGIEVLAQRANELNAGIGF